MVNEAFVRLCEWYILLLYGYWFICMVMVVAQHLSLLPAFEIWIQSHVLVAHSDYSKIFLEQQMCFLNFLSYVGKYTEQAFYVLVTCVMKYVLDWLVFHKISLPVVKMYIPEAVWNVPWSTFVYLLAGFRYGEYWIISFLR